MKAESQFHIYSYFHVTFRCPPQKKIFVLKSQSIYFQNSANKFTLYKGIPTLIFKISEKGVFTSSLLKYFLKAS